MYWMLSQWSLGLPPPVLLLLAACVHVHLLLFQEHLVQLLPTWALVGLLVLHLLLELGVVFVLGRPLYPLLLHLGLHLLLVGLLVLSLVLGLPPDVGLLELLEIISLLSIFLLAGCHQLGKINLLWPSVFLSNRHTMVVDFLDGVLVLVLGVDAVLERFLGVSVRSRFHVMC